MRVAKVLILERNESPYTEDQLLLMESRDCDMIIRKVANEYGGLDRGAIEILKSEDFAYGYMRRDRDE